jgi:hypothetical protein
MVLKNLLNANTNRVENCGSNYNFKHLKIIYHYGKLLPFFPNDVQKYMGCNLLIINIYLVKCNKVLRI